MSRLDHHLSLLAETHQGLDGLLVLDRVHADGALVHDPARLDLVAVHFHEIADNQAVLPNLGPLGHLAVAAAEVADLLVDQSVVDAHLVVDELGEPAKLDVHLRAVPDVIAEREDVRLVPIAVAVVLERRDGLAEDAQLFLADVAVHLFAHQLVELVGQHGLAVLLADQLNGHLALAEARHLDLLAVLFEDAVDLLLVVFRLNRHGQDPVEVVDLFLGDLHVVALVSGAVCGRRDSNPHALRHQILNLACLPIPPRPQGARR